MADYTVSYRDEDGVKKIVAYDTPEQAHGYAEQMHHKDDSVYEVRHGQDLKAVYWDGEQININEKPLSHRVAAVIEPVGHSKEQEVGYEIEGYGI